MSSRTRIRTSQSLRSPPQSLRQPPQQRQQSLRPSIQQIFPQRSPLPQQQQPSRRASLPKVIPPLDKELPPIYEKSIMVEYPEDVKRIKGDNDNYIMYKSLIDQLKNQTSELRSRFESNRDLKESLFELQRVLTMIENSFKN